MDGFRTRWIASLCTALLATLAPAALAEEPAEGLWLSEYVSRAQLTSEVLSREPVDNLEPALSRESGSSRRVYFFTEIQAMQGKSVRHQWLHEERVVADLTFPISANRWRTWSSKLLPYNWAGNWRVRVLDSDGEILAEQRFDYF